MSQDIQNTLKAAMEKSVTAFKADLTKVRTGRANAGMLDGIKIDYYGSLTPLNQAAQINTPEPKTIVIQPWEPALLAEIEKAILKSDLNLNPMNDGKVIRLNIPPLTEERRRDLVKQVKGMAEDSRVAIRHARREANEKFKVLLKDKKISEDENKKQSDIVQKLTDDYISKIDKMVAEKEKELLTI